MDVERKRIAPEHIHLADLANLVRWFVALATTRRAFDPRPGGPEPKWLRDLRRKWRKRLLDTAAETRTSRPRRT
jgi:hypothetical protein